MSLHPLKSTSKVDLYVATNATDTSNNSLFFFLAALSSTIHIATIVATAVLVLTGSNVFPIEFESLPLILHEHSTRTKDLAWRFRNDFRNRILRPVYGLVYPVWTNGQIGDILEIFLSSEKDDMFSEGNLQMIRKVEDHVFSFKDYQSFYCQKNSTYECIKPWSILRLYDGTYSYVSPVFKAQPLRDRNVLCTAMKFNETREYLKFFLEKSYDPCRRQSKASKTRIFFPFGYPLSGGSSKHKIETFLVNDLKPELENMKDGFLKNIMELYYISELMFKYDVTQQAYKDMMLAGGSFLFIFVFMWFQTASFFITFFGILSIITSYLLTNLIYRYAFGFEYFGFFHIIAMFIILGIGADDVFVFYDTWRLSGNRKYSSVAHRLSDCYRKAAKTTFVTSLTTTVAFLVSAFSPLLPVKTFGLFSGILVAVNYICDLIYFPTAIMLYTTKIKPLMDKCCERICSPCSRFAICSKSNKSPCFMADVPDTSFLCSSKSTAAKDSSRLYNIDMWTSKSSVSSEASFDSPKSDTALQSPKSESQIEGGGKSEMKQKQKKTFEERSHVVNFLRNGFFDFLTLRASRFVIPIVFLAISIFFIYEALQLEPDNKQVQIYRSSHNYGKAKLWHYYEFQRNFDEEYTVLYLVWGLKPKDTSVCNLKSNNYCKGSTVWDQGFNPSTPEAQVALFKFCQRLENMTEVETNKLRIRRDAKTGKPGVDCFMTSLDRFLQADVDKNKQNGLYSPQVSMDIPLRKDNVTVFMENNDKIYRSQYPPAGYNRYLEIGVSYWLTNKYTNLPHKDYFVYDPLLGEEWLPGVSQLAQNSFLASYYGTRLRYVGIRVNLTISVYTLGYAEGKPIYDSWETFMREQLDKMPLSMKEGFQCTRNTWHWIMVQQVLAESALQGIVVGLSLACPILIITTMNFVIGIIATIYISLVTTCVIGIIPLVGWKLGVLESLNLCMVVGLSIDYVVHLAEAYNTSPHQDRRNRVRTMFEKMGLSVLSGAATTFGAAIILLFAQIQFLYEFGIFVMSTVSISLLFSFTFFPALMSICGPQGNTGCLITLLNKLCPCRRLRDKTQFEGNKWTLCNIICVTCHFNSLDEIVLDRFHTEDDSSDVRDVS
ncbi:hypothetical protein FSP39_005902 [Pinctada imbricata]|uniref:SSD domain-containing protein n=1 Tax=Pinctada imbricata TaxID=66713 RepID=A0AA88XVL2_PINIB|nr:hypothetical protein FSP39_005902 [Pinctada imbricata]